MNISGFIWLYEDVSCVNLLLNEVGFNAFSNIIYIFKIVGAFLLEVNI